MEPVHCWIENSTIGVGMGSLLHTKRYTPVFFKSETFYGLDEY